MKARYEHLVDMCATPIPVWCATLHYKRNGPSESTARSDIRVLVARGVIEYDHQRMLVKRGNA